MSRDFKRILVCNLGSPSDIVFSIPSFNLLKNMYPNVEVVAIVTNKTKDLVFYLKSIDRVFVIDDYKRSELESKIKNLNGDVFISFFNDELTLKLCKASNASKKIGDVSLFSKMSTYKDGVIQNRIKADYNETEYNLKLVEKLNKKLFKNFNEYDNSLSISSESKVACDIFIKEKGINGKFITIMPFCSEAPKNLTDKDWQEIIGAFCERNKNINVVFICKYDESDRAANIIQNINCNNIFLFANGKNISNIVEIINKSFIFLGPISDAAQIAGALKKWSILVYPNKKEIGVIRYGQFLNKNVHYIIPDKNKNEDDREHYYRDVSDEIKRSIVLQIEKIITFFS